MGDQSVQNDAEALREILGVIDLDRLLFVARCLREVMSLRHGEVILVVKNGRLAFVDIRESFDVRKHKGGRQ
jgi:hypothetical protein